MSTAAAAAPGRFSVATPRRGAHSGAASRSHAGTTGPSFPQGFNMRARMLSMVAAILMLTSAAFAQEAVQPAQATLKVGDKAPPLGKGEWVKGDPVEEFESGKVYVIENWATWCAPCVEAIPHLTELQKKYEDQGVVVIGQNMWEDDPSAVKPFVEKMGDKMD